MSEYGGTLTKSLLMNPDSDIAEILAHLSDDAEIIATPLMDELVYQRKAYVRGIAICEAAIASGAASPLRVAQLQIAMVNLERRKPNPRTELIVRWMKEAHSTCHRVLEHSPNAPGAKRTKVLWHYNAGLLARHDGDFGGDFGGEAFCHRVVSQIAKDEFSRNNAAYMAEVAMMLHHAKAGTATYELWQEFKRAGDQYRATLDKNVPREAQWMANDWGHRVQVSILLDRFCLESDDCLEGGYDALTNLLAVGVPPSSGFAADLIIVIVLGGDGRYGMSLRLLERILSDKEAGDDWRMLAALLKARITGEKDDYRAVVAMPGNGICHAARAVAERMRATM